MFQPLTAAMVRRLLAWYDRAGRDLPWRHTTEAYAVLVSEVMLQQTQVDRVLSYYARWLERFPDWSALAKAPTADVLQVWAGLGYNRRALMLQRIAQHIVAQGVPESREAWMELKGIGPYTSAALTAFSLRQPAVPVDTNIRRVLGRVLLSKPFPTNFDDEKIEQLALPALCRSKRGPDVPQAIFDLAALVCKKVPDCRVCPLRQTCLSAEAFMSGKVKIPKRSVAKSSERVHPGKRFPDRIYRGRILSVVRQARAGAPLRTLGKAIDPLFDVTQDLAWLEAMVARLTKDGLIERRRSRLHLPRG